MGVCLIAAALLWSFLPESAVRIEPWGTNAFRVRVSPAGSEIYHGALTALLPQPLDGVKSTTTTTSTSQTNGNLRVETVGGQRRFGRLRQDAVRARTRVYVRVRVCVTLCAVHTSSRVTLWR